MESKRELAFIHSPLWRAVKSTPLYSIYEKHFRKQVENYRRDRQAHKLRKYGYAMLSDIFQCTSKKGVDVFALYGTLLGFIREKDFIKFDFDIDLGVFCDDDSTFAKIELALLDTGFTKVREFVLEGKIVEQTYNRAGLDVDFFGIFPHENKYITYGFYKDGNVNYKSAELFSVKYWIMEIEHALKTINIHDVAIRIPQDYEYMLEVFYGKTWRIPDPNFVSIAKVMDKSVMGKEIRFN